MMTDPIADMLTRIRNANRIGKRKVQMPASKTKVGIAQILVEQGFIEKYTVTESSPVSLLDVRLKYGPDGEQVIRTIRRVSRPGHRVYSSVDDMPRALRGMGIYILSTPKGILSDRTAVSERVGGEILCEVF